MPPHRFAIVNAQCLGHHAQVDERIIESFERGFVTTATLLAYGATAVKAVSMAHAARRNDESCFVGVVMSEREKEAAQQEGSFHPQPPPSPPVHNNWPATEEQRDCTYSSTPLSAQALPLGLLLTADIIAAEERNDNSAAAAKKGRRKRSTAATTPSTATHSQPPSSAIVERRMRQQIEWFTSLTGYPPLFISSQNQFHTSSPHCELLARLLPLYSIRWVTFLEAACSSPPAHGSTRRSNLAQSRTARFVYGQHQLLTPQYEAEWASAHTMGWNEEMGECKKGVTEIHVRFDAGGAGVLDAQRAVLELCDQQQIVLVNHQQASTLSYVHPTLPATLHELSIPSHHSASFDTAPSAWHTLPSDLIHAFHAFLSPASFLLSRRTCRAWQKRALLPGVIWSRLLFHVHPHLPSSTLSRMCETKLPIRKVRVEAKTVSAGSINELRSIGRLTHLTHLTLVNCTGVADGLKSGGDWIAGIRGLQHLTITACDLSDDSVQFFSCLSALVSLDLSDCPLSQAGVATLARCAFPQLATVTLSHRHSPDFLRVADQYDDEVQALSHIQAATHTLSPTDSTDHTASDNNVAAAKIAAGVRWPSLREVDMSFAVVSDGEEFDRYVDAVYAFRRARPQVTLRTGLNAG